MSNDGSSDKMTFIVYYDATTIMLTVTMMMMRGWMASSCNG